MKNSKKIGTLLIVAIFMLIGIYLFFNYLKRGEIVTNIDTEANIIGIKNSKSFAIDENGNVYVAFRDKIKFFTNDSREETILTDSSLYIYDLVYYKKSLIIATASEIIKIDLSNLSREFIISNLPNRGLNKETKLLIYKDTLYVTIGTNTNTGIADVNNPFEDIPSYSWKLDNKTYGDIKTSPFQPYGVVSKDSIVKGESYISNGTIIAINLINNEVKNFVSGISNIGGFDYDSSGNIYSIVKGLKDEGVRPVINDRDYLYSIKEGNWYGWPDYSGGDPLDSPRFTFDNYKIERILINPITKSPMGPIYVYKEGNALGEMIIDREGTISDKDSILFVDNRNHIINSYKNKVVNVVGVLTENNYISKIRSYKSDIYFLDSKEGKIFIINNLTNKKDFKLPKLIIVFMASLLLAFSSSIYFKRKKK